MTIGDLTYSLGAEWDKKSLDGIRDGFASVSKSFISAVGIASASMAGTFAVVQQFAKVNDELGKMARNRDIAVDSLQAMQYSFESAGLAGSKAGDVLAKLQEQREGFKLGKADYYALDRLQINPQAYKNNEDFFNAVIDGLKNVKDEGEKADLANRLLGSTEMKNLIDGGSEALRRQKQELAEMGVLVNDQDYQASADFNDTLLKTTTILKGLVSKVMTSLMPIFTKLMKQFNAFLKANRELIASGLKQFLRAVIDGSRFFLSLIGRVIEHLGGLKVVIAVIAGLLLAWQLPLIATIGVIVGLLLVFDDLMNFIKGNDSVIGDFANSLNGVEKSVLAIASAFVALKLAIMATTKARKALRLADLGLSKGGKGVGLGGKGSGIGGKLMGGLIVGGIAYESTKAIGDYLYNSSKTAEEQKAFFADKKALSGYTEKPTYQRPSDGGKTLSSELMGNTTNIYNITANVDAKSKTVGEAISEITHPQGY